MKQNNQAITLAVGAFIREVRNGNKKPSMNKLLRENGVRSANRAKNLIQRMKDNDIIRVHRDGSVSLTKSSFNSEEIMPILLKRTRTVKVKEIFPQTELRPLETYTALDLVTELRARGYEVKATRQVITTEEL